MSGTAGSSSESEASTPVAEVPGVEGQSTEVARESIGSYLSAQRQLRGISIEELSQQTRIPLRSLERLEAGSFDADVDGFVRGFVRTVAEALGLDPDETLNRTLHEPGGAAGGASSQLSLSRVVATVLGLALLAGVGFAVQLIAVSLADSGDAGPRSAIVMRRDPVRALAEAQGVAALAPAPAMALASRASPERPGEADLASSAEAPDGETDPGPAAAEPPARPGSDAQPAPIGP